MGPVISKFKQQDSCSNFVTIYYSEGEKYIGECLPGQQVRQGQGTYIFSNGDKYEGEWRNSMKHGKGYFFYSNGELYMGQWENNKRNGIGMYFYQNGTRYEGMWKDSMKHGEGTLYAADKSVFQGQFKENKKHGICVKKMSNGTTYEEEWQEDVLVNTKLLMDATANKQVQEEEKKDNVTFEKILVSEWKSEQVCEWLDAKGFSHYKENFKSNHITGQNLFELTEKDLQDDLNIKDDGDRDVMMSEINSLLKMYKRNIEQSEYVNQHIMKYYHQFEKLLEKKDESDSSDSSPDEEEKKEEKKKQKKKVPPREIVNQGQITEYHTILYNYEQSDHDLLETVSRTLGEFSLVNFSEITLGPSIGKGGYGEVFKARWLEDDVAVKFFGRGRFLKEKKIDTDFLREVNVLNRLRHPNIVLFMGVSITPENKGALLTEYLEGGSLFDYIHKKREEFDEEQILKIALDMALGMHYLHAQKIFHCDLKSSNILLDEHLNVKIVDFGLSKLRRRSEKKKNFQRVGTLLWMAPEIMREEEYDEFSDVYSYGMIIWELLAKKLPFQGLKLPQIIGAVGYGDKQVEKPETDNRFMLELANKCLLKDRKERPRFKKIIKYLRDSENTRKKLALQELDSAFG